MKFVRNNSMFMAIYSLIFAPQVLANGDESHAPGEMHNDAVAVDPFLIIVPIVLLLGGIIIWKVMLSKKQSPPTQAPQAQTEAPKTSQPSNQPEKLEAQK